MGKSITKEIFLKVYNKHKPSKFSVFMFKYFSTKITNKTYGTIFSIVCFVIASIGILFDIRWAVWLYLGFGLLLITLPVSLFNNRRIKKICKELHMNIDSCDYCCNLYL